MVKEMGLNDRSKPRTEPTRLVYIIGTYPGLTTTFIDREIFALKEQEGFEIKIVSVRFPHNAKTLSPEQRSMCKDTIYLIPQLWREFDYLKFISAFLYYLFAHPWLFIKTLSYVLTQPHPSLRVWFMTIVHFLFGVYTAYLLRRSEFDHIHVHFLDRAALIAWVVSRFLKKTYSLTAHAVDIYAEPVLIPVKIVNARFLVTCSQYNKQHLLKTYAGIDQDRIYVSHPWIDLAKYLPAGSRNGSPVFHILSVGRLVEKKGHADLLEACHLLRERGISLECRIIGDGPQKPNLEQRIKQLDLQDQVHLLGGQPHDVVQHHLVQWADVFVLACIVAPDGDRDGIPVSLAEAMAGELPVVSTDIVGIHELVQPGAGLLVPSHHPAALAHAISAVYDMDPAQRQDMGHKAREIVNSEFNQKTGISMLANLFREVVDEKWNTETGIEDKSIHPFTHQPHG
jgi:glycosyltransferase involved in cell wall biosynthesis